MNAPTPLPELEAQLHAAAQRLDAATAPRRRRWWRHGWSLLTIFVVAAGASVAVARVAEVGPFAYMSGSALSRDNPKLAPTTVITVQPAGDAPPWQARAYRNGLDQVCMTGGPRDPRTNPDAKPTRERWNNPPQNGVMCASSEEIAQRLLDPNRPGATFAMSSHLDGSLQGRVGRIDAKTGRFVPMNTDPPTRLLVYGITSADGPRPVVRWGADGEPIAMQASRQRLRLPVNRSPQGLDPAEQRTVAAFPAELGLVLWAADVKIPAGVREPQVIFPTDVVPHGVDDATIELVGTDEMIELIERGKRAGWKYERGISRDPLPIGGPSDEQRRQIAAFARKRVAGDRVPPRLRTEQAASSRLAFGASRKLDVTGGGLEEIWIAPGAPTEDMVASNGKSDLVCLLGAAILRQCKYGTSRWKRPFVEAVACARAPLGGRETFVWALTPPGAERVELVGRDGARETLPAGELVAVRRPVDGRIERLTWTGPGGKKTRVQVPWPSGAPPRCDRDRPAGTITRKDNAGSHEETGPPPGR